MNEEVSKSDNYKYLVGDFECAWKAIMAASVINPAIPRGNYMFASMAGALWAFATKTYTSRQLTNQLARLSMAGERYRAFEKYWNVLANPDRLYSDSEESAHLGLTGVPYPPDRATDRHLTQPFPSGSVIVETGQLFRDLALAIRSLEISS